MDTSETYIKMCERAQEIQNSRPVPPWNIESNGSNEPCAYIRSNVWSESDVWVHPDPGNMSNYYFWLPRQDQLQEMAELALEPLIDSFNCFHQDLSDEPDFDSMEQLWLAFVMHEKYGKTWNENDWVKAL